MPSLSPPAASVPPRHVSHALAAFALALLLGLQPVSTDVYLPALPMLTRALGAPMTRGAADDVGADPRLRPRPAVLGAGGRPRRPPPGAAVGPGAVHAGQRRLRGGRQHRDADRRARAAGRLPGRGGGGGTRHPARPVRAARRRARDVAGAVGAGRDRHRRAGAGRAAGGHAGLARHAGAGGDLRRRDARLRRTAPARNAAAQEPARHCARAAARGVVADRRATRPSWPGRC